MSHDPFYDISGWCSVAGGGKQRQSVGDNRDGRRRLEMVQALVALRPLPLGTFGGCKGSLSLSYLPCPGCFVPKRNGKELGLGTRLFGTRLARLSPVLARLSGVRPLRRQLEALLAAAWRYPPWLHGERGPSTLWEHERHALIGDKNRGCLGLPRASPVSLQDPPRLSTANRCFRE